LTGSNYVAKYTFINGIYELNTASEIQVYPNPANDYIAISNNSISKFKTEIYSVDGKLLKQNSYNNAANNIVDISDLSRGVYMLKVIDNIGVSTSRIVIER